MIHLVITILLGLGTFVTGVWFTEDETLATPFVVLLSLFAYSMSQYA